MKIKRYRIVKEINGCYRGEYRFIFTPFWWYIDESITMSLEECERYVTNYINNGHAGFVKYMPILLILSLNSCDSGESSKPHVVDSSAHEVRVIRDTVYIDTNRYWFVAYTIYYKAGWNTDGQTAIMTGKKLWYSRDIMDSLSKWCYKQKPKRGKISKIILTNLTEMKNWEDYASFNNIQLTTN